ncbi:hypothetical protein [Pseudonocardia pini]|uniref:hypothetical protein n=1 Tax=Pseudonocardia pini TaxID=2758030 RepID=UPI0015F1095F|nr:hypothetical protein [Pseudonocardia pini]
MTEHPRTDLRPTPADGATGHARLTAATGLLFVGLFVAALVLLHTSPGLGVADADYAAFYADGGGRTLVTIGTTLVPFAGIAFLWHLTTLRLLVRARTPTPSAIPDGLQLLSGIMFVVLLFVGTGAAGATALLMDLTNAPLPSVGIARSLSGLGYGIVFVYAIRGAGMYAITSTTLLAKAGLLPRWAAVVGYLLAAVLLLATTFNPAVVLVFPAWVLLISAMVLVTSRSTNPDQEGVA